MPEDKERYYGKNLQQKLNIIKDFGEREEAGHVCFFIEESSKTQAELLEANKKEVLLSYCDFAGLRASSNWRKIQIAEVYSGYLQENLWIFLMIIPQENFSSFLRFSKCRNGESVALDTEEERRALYIMVCQGLLEPYYEMRKTGTVFGMEFAKGMADRIIKYYRDRRNFGETAPAAVYLPPELRAGCWKNVGKGYVRLDERVRKILMYYGMLNTKKLYEVLLECYQYRFDYETFMRFLLLRMRLLEMVQTAYNRDSKERWAALGGFPIADACMEMGEAAIEYRPASSSQLEERERFILLLVRPLAAALLLNHTDGNGDDVEIYLEYLISAVQLRAPWEFFSQFLQRMTDRRDRCQEMEMWRCVSSLFLKLPVYSLGGYSRMEYAALHQMKNPYEIHNGTRQPQALVKNPPLFYRPYAMQWELFCRMDKNMEEPGNGLSGKTGGV